MKCKHDSVTKRYSYEYLYAQEPIHVSYKCNKCEKEWSEQQWSFRWAVGWLSYLSIAAIVVFIIWIYL